MADNIQDPNDVRRSQNPQNPEQRPGSTQGQPGQQRPEGTTGREGDMPGQEGGRTQPGQERPRDPNRPDEGDDEEGGMGGGSTER